MTRALGNPLQDLPEQLLDFTGNLMDQNLYSLAVNEPIFQNIIVQFLHIPVVYMGNTTYLCTFQRTRMARSASGPKLRELRTDDAPKSTG